MTVKWSVHSGFHDEFPKYFSFEADLILNILSDETRILFDRRIVILEFPARGKSWEGHWDNSRRRLCQSLEQQEVFVCLHDILYAAGSTPAAGGGTFVDGEAAIIRKGGEVIGMASVANWHDRAIRPILSKPLLNANEAQKNYKRDMVRH